MLLKAGIALRSSHSFRRSLRDVVHPDIRRGHL